MLGYAYYSGRYSSCDDVKIPLRDRSVFFADAVYDVAIGMGRCVYQLREHTERLINSCTSLGISLPREISYLEKIIDVLTERTNYDSFMLYLQIARCMDERCHSAKKSHASSLLAFVTPISLPVPEEVSICCAEDKRYKLCNIKTTNLIPAVQSAIEAEERGFDETVYIRDGRITECSHSNIIIFSAGALITAPVGEAVLPGITRANILHAAEKRKIPRRSEFFGHETLISADEIFISSTTKLLRRVTKIDNKSVGRKREDIYMMLQSDLFDDFLKKCDKKAL